MSTALVLGATGLVGRSVLAALASDAAFDRVIVLARRPADGPLATKIEWRVVDFDAAATYDALRRDAPEAVFSCLGTTRKQTPSLEQYRKIDHDYPVSVARAVAPKAVFCLISAVGADAKSRVFYNRLKGEVEADVAASGVASVYALRPSFLLGERGGGRVGEALGIAAFKALGPLMPSRFRSIEAKTVAAAMIRAAKQRTPGVHVWHYREMLG